MRATRREVLRKAGLAASLISVPAVAGTVVANRAEATPMTADPIYALIDAHRQALDLIDATEEEGDGSEFQAACDAETELFLRLMRTPPTTAHGILAYIAYVHGHNPELSIYGEPDTQTGVSYQHIVFGTLHAAVRQLAGLE